jgi:hypothetical protein
MRLISGRLENCAASGDALCGSVFGVTIVEADFEACAAGRIFGQEA